jgi:dTDP-glucose 4,6-dehydratase
MLALSTRSWELHSATLPAITSARPRSHRIRLGVQVDTARGLTAAELRARVHYTFHADMKNLPSVLVTGGAGFIGSALVRHLVRRGDRHVVTLDALSYSGNLDSLAEITDSPRHTFIHADIADAEAVRRALEAWRPTHIYHLAAESHVDRSIDAPADFVRTNLVGTFVLLQESLRYYELLRDDEREAFRFLHVSTDEVFGSLGEHGAFTRETPYDPSSPYSATKAGSDHLARAWHRTYGLPVLVTNCSNNYGPCQFPEKLIPLMILNGLQEKPLPVYGSGMNVRDWLYVDDHVAALDVVMARGAPGRTYLVGGGAERTNLQVVEALCALLDERLGRVGVTATRRLITPVADRPGHDFRYAVDCTDLRTELGWSPVESFESGLARTVDWYLRNQAWWERVRSGAYRWERLGLRSLK